MNTFVKKQPDQNALYSISSPKLNPNLEDSDSFSTSFSDNSVKLDNSEWSNCQIVIEDEGAQESQGSLSSQQSPSSIEEDDTVENEHFQKLTKKIEKYSKTGASSRSKRTPWQKEEDLKVLELVAKFGLRWGVLARHMKGRSGKQIRDRYINNLKPGAKVGCWTEEEDQILLSLYKVYGRKWSQISKQMPGRSEYQVKNRFRSLSKRDPFLSKEQKVSTSEQQNFIQSSKPNIETPITDMIGNNLSSMIIPPMMQNSSIQHSLAFQNLALINLMQQASAQNFVVPNHTQTFNSFGAGLSINPLMTLTRANPQFISPLAINSLFNPILEPVRPQTTGLKPELTQALSEKLQNINFLLNDIKNLQSKVLLKSEQ